MLRIAAEFENWKKRARKEQTDAVAQARERVLQGHARGGRQPRARGRHAGRGQRRRRRRRGAEGGRSWCCACFKQKLERYEVQAVRGDGPAVRSARARGDLAGRAAPRSRRARSRPSCRRAIASASGCCGRRWSRCRSGAEGPTTPPVGGLGTLPRRLLRDAGRRSRLDRRRDQGGLPQAGAEVAPGSQPGRQGGRGALQGAGDRLCGAVRRGQARALRSLRRGRRRRARSAATDVTGATEFFDALFGDLFGLARRRSAAGRDLRYTLELDFEEAALGCEKAIVFERPEDCAACSGTGAEGGSAGLVTCARCGGEGVIRKKAGFLTSRRDCMGCGGTGQVPRVRCTDLRGRGPRRSRAALHGAHPARLDGRVDAARAARGRRRGGAAGRRAICTSSCACARTRSTAASRRARGTC